MFKSIVYINSTYNSAACLYLHNFKITDSDFISNSLISEAPEAPSQARSLPVVVAIKEYENRNYTHKEIVKNLFLLNMFMLKEWDYEDLNQILERQHKYLIKENFPETNFHEKYYDDLLNYTKKMMVIL